MRFGTMRSRMCLPRTGIHTFIIPTFAPTVTHRVSELSYSLTAHLMHSRGGGGDGANSSRMLVHVTHDRRTASAQTQPNVYVHTSESKAKWLERCAAASRLSDRAESGPPEIAQNRTTSRAICSLSAGVARKLSRTVDNCFALVFLCVDLIF